MIQNIDYRKYDPQNFIADHPYDYQVEEARRKANELAEQFRNQSSKSGNAAEFQRTVHQSFDNLHEELEDRRKVEDRIEQLELLQTFKNTKTDAIYKEAFLQLDEARNDRELEASWKHVNQEVEQARQDAPNDPEYLQQREQLEQFQAARSEAISNDIHSVQQNFLEEKGLENWLENDPAREHLQSFLDKLGAKQNPDNNPSDEHLPEN